VGFRPTLSPAFALTCASWSRDDFEKLADRLAGTLKVMREIANIAGKKG